MSDANSTKFHANGIDLTNKKFGSLTVLEFVGRTARGAYLWKCRCECGTIIETIGSDLSRPRDPRRHCGCQRSANISTAKRTHGLSKNLVFKIWERMISRCHNSQDEAFAYYGGRGIAVCNRWRESFADFLADVGERPSRKHSIDRYPNNDGNYEPGNCRWATDTEQSRNTRRNHFVTIGAETLCVSAWCERFKIKPAVVHCRLRYGWTIEKALTTPVLKTWSRQRKT